MSTSCQRLPTAGETILIHGLVFSPALNGKQGLIAKYMTENQRYCIKVNSDDSSKKTLAMKPSNILLLPNKKIDSGSSLRGNDAFYYHGEDWCIMHILVPCHLESRQRYNKFRQCARSLVHQVGHCRISISLSSGKAKLNQLVMDTL